jgi:hypothetical protein
MRCSLVIERSTRPPRHSRVLVHNRHCLDRPAIAGGQGELEQGKAVYDHTTGARIYKV